MARRCDISTSETIAAAPGDIIAEYYGSRVRQFGPTLKAVDYKNEESQNLRFRTLCEFCPLADRSIHEIGCGVGHMVDFLEDYQPRAWYSGSDISSEMIRAARARHPEVTFSHRDIRSASPGEAYDVVVAPGVFYTKLGIAEDEWYEWVHATIQQMFAMSRIGIAFNAMTDQVDFRVDHLCYTSPGAMFEFCRKALSRHVVLRQDYGLYEYTMYVYRSPNRNC